MRLFRISIAGLMGLVLFVAICFAALRDSSWIWAGVIFILTLGGLCTAMLRAVTRRGNKGLPWLGFAVFGWLYFIVAFRLHDTLIANLFGNKYSHALLARGYIVSSMLNLLFAAVGAFVGRVFAILDARPSSTSAAPDTPDPSGTDTRES